MRGTSWTKPSVSFFLCGEWLTAIRARFSYSAASASAQIRHALRVPPPLHSKHTECASCSTSLRPKQGLTLACPQVTTTSRRTQTPPGRIPSLKADKRKGFIYNRSLSVLTWSICVLTVSEVISAYLRIPLTSTLAFGGIGGLAIGLAGKVSRCACLPDPLTGSDFKQRTSPIVTSKSF